MPNQIYEIAEKLGVDQRKVLAIAINLGMDEANLRSSSLDRKTAELLESKIASAIQEESKINEAKVKSTRGDKVATPNRLQGGSEVARISGGEKRKREKLRESHSVVPKNKNNDDDLNNRFEKNEVNQAGQMGNGGRNFEIFVKRIIERSYPYCSLSNVLIFNAQMAHFHDESENGGVRQDYAYEIDHMLHGVNQLKDVITLIECKNQFVEQLSEENWQVEYKGNGTRRVKNVQEQVINHAYALRAYVNPLSRGRKLSVEVIVVSSAAELKCVSRRVNSWLTLHLTSVKLLLDRLKLVAPKPLKIAQSDLLGLLRLGMPLAELGHPEIPNAIAYIERCRRHLDLELFRVFEPTPTRWAINGSAGMGKSVLLAYSLFVLTTDRVLQIRDGKKVLADFAEEAKRLKIPPIGSRKVYAFALKEKQRKVISFLFQKFIDDYSYLSNGTDFWGRRADIRLWTGKIPNDCHVLLLDEAHDISSEEALEIVRWHNESSSNKYLIVACDRHQKLRLVAGNEAIIPGLSFSLKTKKLRLNYRNPSAVYAASLALMFRWFASSGPKVIPTVDDLENGFGFSVRKKVGANNIELSIRNDAHPANGWCHCVSMFESCESAFARLVNLRLNPSDVLWVRFGDETPLFDYERLSCFTYHNLNTHESQDLADKYIKGQDFPVVVIEGLPSALAHFDTEEEEDVMWGKRKELYLCSSRATAFLFFVVRESERKNHVLGDEIRTLVNSLDCPSSEVVGYSRAWQLNFNLTNESRKMSVFSDAS